MTRPRAALLLAAAMLLTGSNVPLGKLIVAEVPVYPFILFRFVVASLALALLVRGEPGPPLTSLDNRQRIDLVAMALLGMVGFSAFMLEGVKRTAAADAGIITATMPAVVALMGMLFMGDRLGGRGLASIALAVGGLVLVQATGAVREAASSGLGNLLVGLAVIGEASFVLLGKRLTPPLKPIRLALGANLAGLVLTLPLALPELRTLDLLAIQPELWGLSLWYVLSAGVFCLLLWYRAIPHVETWLAGLATAAIPIAALAVAAALLGEAIGPARLAGAALVIAGIVLGASRSKTGDGGRS